MLTITTEDTDPIAKVRPKHILAGFFTIGVNKRGRLICVPCVQGSARTIYDASNKWDSRLAIHVLTVFLTSILMLYGIIRLAILILFAMGTYFPNFFDRVMLIVLSACLFLHLIWYCINYEMMMYFIKNYTSA